jgi:glycosyltransferase involved in cell wall biosynthesis
MTVRVAVSSVGRFHHFDLAGQLHRLGCLAQLYTGYPRSRVDTIPAGLVSSFPYVITPAMALYRLGLRRTADSLSRLSHETLDWWVARRLCPCDVLVCNHGNGLVSYRTARKYGARVVCDCGQPHIEFVRRALQEEFQRWGSHFRDYDSRSLDRRLREYAEANLITVPSSFTRQAFLAAGVPSGKLAVIPYGVDLSLFRPIPKRDPVFRVLFVGELGIVKGLPYLLQAVAGLKRDDVELVLIGGMAPEGKALLGRLGGGVRFRYLGFLPRDRLHAEYSQASLFVLPSIVDGLALVIPQAMACGLPVIATPNTGAEDLVTDGVEGRIVPAAASGALREAILELYENRALRQEMATAALRRVRQLGGWDRYGERVVQVYSELCGTPGPRTIRLSSGPSP